MASKATASNSTTTTAASAALFLFLNLLFFAMKTGACGSSCPTPITPKPPSGGGGGKCPVDTLKLVVCANVLDGLITVGLGKFPKQPCECCTLIAGLVDLEAAVCLCTVVRANVHGISLNVPIEVSLLLNYCGKKIPEDFQCPY